MAFSENIPAWLKAIPEELVSLVDLPGLYGLNLYCRAATIGLGAVMGVVSAGLAGPVGGGLTGFFVGKLSCNAIEDRAVRAKMCYEFNELVCPKRRLDIEKVRHPSIGVDPMQAKKCPPCPEKREMGEFMVYNIFIYISKLTFSYAKKSIYFSFICLKDK